MRLATVRQNGGTRAGRLDGEDELIFLDADDVGQLLRSPDWRGIAERSDGSGVRFSEADLAPVVPRPSKIICVGLNYRSHILEMGRELPGYPTLFAKFSASLIGARDELLLPAASREVDWEAELGVIVGERLRKVSPEEARRGIAGYTIVNDVSMRDWQWRTPQWLQGKTFEASTPVGPFLVTPEEVGHAEDLELRCEVDGEVVQEARTSDLVFGPADVVSYISQFITLEPGDLIATGTPGGVGAGREPKVFLSPGQILRTSIEGLGECVNRCVEETGPRS